MGKWGRSISLPNVRDYGNVFGWISVGSVLVEAVVGGGAVVPSGSGIAQGCRRIQHVGVELLGGRRS